ncbi:hypothetical protein PY650_36065 [Rhizobium calliandrae]|uniref:Histidine kinase/HSP90-like ATPase domain-containing protein n=1 Tax=Rhizobium calliandrae TaxID=1312182 RepID=A0ABT7KT65_9HYPH|nr:ATP-binding protein [Rhizobium calliandrae]MDL2410854.1 hypothetical protein [Rhizobium calliandrae]
MSNSKIENGLVLVSGAMDFIFRAVRNLVENALHHSPDNGVTTISVFNICVGVADQGPGFTKIRLSAVGQRLIIFNVIIQVLVSSIRHLFRTTNGIATKWTGVGKTLRRATGSRLESYSRAVSR